MYRTEMTIPVRKDPRTFEESRSALFDNLERSMTSHREHSGAEDSLVDATSPRSDGASQNSSSTTTTTSSTRTSSTRTVGAGKESEGLTLDEFHHGDDWNVGVSDWIRDSRRKWDSEMKRIRESFFSLESSGDMFGGRDDALMWPAGLTADMNNMRLVTTSGSSSTSVQQSFSCSSSSSMSHSSTQQQQQQMSSSSTITSSNALQSSNTSETSSSTTQFYSSSSSSAIKSAITGEDALLNDNRALLAGMGDPFAGFPSSRALMGLNKDTTISNAFDKSKDLYELGEDGKLHFKVRFEAQDYSPDDIQVSTVGNRLMVKAKAVKKTENSTSVKEFSRSVDLPDRIDHENFSCNLTKDGVLEIDAPVKAPNYEAISFLGGELGIKPRMITSTESAPSGVMSTRNESSRQLVVMNKPGLAVIDNEFGKKVVHIELPIETGYLPNDIHVRAEGTKIYIKGRHEEVSGGRSSFKEFSKYYDVSESLDPLSVDALVNNNTLIIEAPLKFS